jgi:hypothetical protein
MYQNPAPYREQILTYSTALAFTGRSAACAPPMASKPAAEPSIRLLTKRSDRPELVKAIAFAKKHRARLIIAKLDRLSRNVAFISALMERRVDFIAVDNPHATKFNLHILAAVAEFERDAISRRTREALAAAKARGVKLGNYARIAKAKQAAMRARAEAVRPMIAETVHLPLQGAADELNRRSLTTAGGKPWHAMQVSRARRQLGLTALAT